MIGPLWRRAAAAALLFAALCTGSGHAFAGRSCETVAPAARSVQRGLELAVNTARTLDASGAQVVALGRAGQDLSKYGLRWSHFGWAYKAPASDDPQRMVWRVVHKLNQCGSATAQVYRQGLAEFFLDDPFEYRATFVVPTPDLQARLLPLLQDNQRAATLHTEAYNMLAYPWAQLYQQSNQWALETLALVADDSSTSRERAQAWLRWKGYEPTQLRITAFTRLGARLTAANIAFDDHPNSQRFADRIDTVTVDSVFVWLKRAGLATAPQEIR